MTSPRAHRKRSSTRHVVRWAIGALTLPLFVRTSAALSQSNPPRALVASTPSTLASPRVAGELTAVLTSGPNTLWILYADRNDQNRAVVRALEVRDVGTATASVQAHDVGEGVADTGALTLHGDRILAAVRDRSTLRLWSRARAGGEPTNATTTASGDITRTSTASDGRRPFVCWTDTGGAHCAPVDPNSAQTQSPVSGATLSVLSAAPVFGGVAVVRERSGTSLGALAVSPARRAFRARVLAATRSVADPHSVSVSSAQNRLYVAYETGGQVMLATVTGATGAGRAQTVAAVSGNALVAVGAQAYGALVAWASGGQIRVQPIDTRGAPLGDAFTVAGGTTPETPRSLTVAGLGNETWILWSRPATSAREPSPIRAVRIRFE